MGKLAGQCGQATNQLQAAVMHALDAPFEVMDIDFDIVGNRVAIRSGKLRSMAAILLARELGLELNDAPIDRLQLKDLRRRWLPCGKRHAFEIFQNAASVHGVGLGPLHACPGKFPHRPQPG